MATKTHKSESALHIGLVKDLLGWFENEKGYRITGADLEGHTQPNDVENSNKIGDGENKRPDIDAFSDAEKVYVRGEAKTGDGDLETEHSKTQFLLFANRQNSNNNKPSLLYVIVPASKFGALEALLNHIGLEDKPNVIAVKSGEFN